MRVLLVEDDAALARGLIKTLRSQGLAVDHVSHGQEALDVVEREPYSAVILDLGLPDMDGLTVLRRLRQAGSRAPVLILTARDTTSDRVNGLDQGADDYLSKPFALSELEARVRALIRRGQGISEPRLVFGPLSLERATGAVYLSGTLLDLPRRERSVLEGLMVRSEKVVPRDRLAAEVFGYDEPVAPNALEVYIARLRRKLETSGVEIVTVRGLGYLLRRS
jgi:DNA-binding response OmpR family regulator